MKLIKYSAMRTQSGSTKDSVRSIKMKVQPHKILLQAPKNSNRKTLLNNTCKHIWNFGKSKENRDLTYIYHLSTLKRRQRKDNKIQKKKNRVR